MSSVSRAKRSARYFEPESALGAAGAGAGAAAAGAAVAGFESDLDSDDVEGVGLEASPLLSPPPLFFVEE